MICKAILKNDVKASYTNKLIPAGTEIEVVSLPPISTPTQMTKHQTFIYAILVYEGKHENLHIYREDVVGGEKIKSKN